MARPLCTCSERGEPDWNGAHDADCPWLMSKPDTVDVPLFAADFELIDMALGRLTSDHNDVDHNAIAELRDRLKRSRLLP